MNIDLHNHVVPPTVLDAIRKNPECWLWMYKHWRYLPTTQRDSSYPEYANPSQPFRDLIAARAK